MARDAPAPAEDLGAQTEAAVAGLAASLRAAAALRAVALARLREGFTPAELQAAQRGARADPWVAARGLAGSTWPWATAERVLALAEQWAWLQEQQAALRAREVARQAAADGCGAAIAGGSGAEALQTELPLLRLVGPRG